MTHFTCGENGEAGRDGVLESYSSAGIQRTGHAQAFGVEIAHGGFQGLVPHRLLNGAGIGSPLQAMRGVGVTEFVRQNHDTKLAPGCLDGALHIGFVHPIPDH